MVGSVDRGCRSSQRGRLAPSFASPGILSKKQLFTHFIRLLVRKQDRTTASGGADEKRALCRDFEPGCGSVLRSGAKEDVAEIHPPWPPPSKGGKGCERMRRGATARDNAGLDRAGFRKGRPSWGNQETAEIEISWNCKSSCTSRLTLAFHVQYDLHIDRGRSAADAAVYAWGTEGDAPALGAWRDEARGSPGAVPRTDQESGPPFLPDDAGRKGSRDAPEGREGVLLQAGDATAVGVPFDARGIRRRLLRRLDPDPGAEHHQVGEAQRGRPPQAEATRRPSPDAKPRGSRSRK